MGIKRQSPGKWQVFSETGAGAGYKLHTYIPGTTDDKETYQDKDGATPNANPVVFDARGEADIWFDGTYDLRLTKADDTLIWTLSDFGAGEGIVNYGNYNLITDGGFEDDTNGDGLPDQWDTTAYPTGGTGAGVVIIDTVDQLEGARSLKFTSVGDGGGYGVSNFFNVREGGEVACQWAMKSTVAGVRNVVELIWYTAAQVQISTSSLYDDSTTNPTSWAVKSGTATAPSTARFAKIRIIGCHSSDPTAGATWFDDVKAVSDTIFGDLTIVNDLSVGGTLGVTGAFTSPGIDDNASAEQIDITGTTVTVNNALTVAGAFTASGSFTSQGIDDNANEIAITIGADESVTIAEPTAAIALTANGVAGHYGIRAFGSSTAGQSFGLNVTAGATSADQCFKFESRAGVSYLTGYGDGGVVVGNPTGGNPNSAGVINASGLKVNNVDVITGAVTQAKLSTTTGSQGGSVAATSAVTISLNSYSFFPDIESEQACRLDPSVVASPSASADSPQFVIRNDSGSALLYSVAWRYVIA